jgi:High potential iron-sulfur protein
MRFDSPLDRDRRRLLYWLGSFASMAGLPVLRAVRAQTPTRVANSTATSTQRVSESDPLAQALGYKEDAAKVDRAKYPAFKPGEKCATCRFFQGAAGQPYGPCQIFSGKLVHSGGWCTSYNAKT